jgi:hypothetical protein
MPDKKKPAVHETGSNAETEGLRYQRAANFTTTYANNAYFESSAWDLKIVFGQLEQPPEQPPVITQHIAVTIPWAQAKLALYYLRLHVEGNELQNGKILIRKDLLPTEPAPLTPEQEKDPLAKGLYEIFRKCRAEFLESF